MSVKRRATYEDLVVYFDTAAAVVFWETQVIVPVHAKHPDNDAIPVCYCFGYTEKSIRDEIEQTGASTATRSITAEVKADRCACEVRNPKGSCCLGDVARVERRVASSLPSRLHRKPHDKTTESDDID